MTKDDFDAFVSELVQHVAREHPGTRLFVAVFPPGSFDGKAQPLTAATLPVEAQPIVLRSLADSIDNGATLILSKVVT